MSTDATHFRNRVVVLTGVGHAGQAGEAIAHAFARAGSRLIVVDRQQATIDARLADLGSAGFDATGFACDLSDEGAVSELGVRIDSLAGADGISALVCAAGGFGASGKVAESTMDALQRQLNINLMTAWLTTRALLPALRRSTGSIVYFTSAITLPGGRVSGVSAYAAAKSALVALMRAVAQEERDNGVRANALAPTAIRTAQNLKEMDKDYRFVERDVLAEMVLFLCSPAAASVSGEVIRLA